MSVAPINVATGEIVGRSLDECEAVIEKGLGTFVEVGEALVEIRDRRLYQIEFSNFDSYCRERWGFNRQRAHQLIGAAEVVGELSTFVDVPLPQSEAQARALTPLKDNPEEMREVMEAASAEAEAEGAKVTAERITEKVTERVEKTQPKQRTLDQRKELLDAYEACKKDQGAAEQLARAWGFSGVRALRMYCSATRRMLNDGETPMDKLARLSEDERIRQITELAAEGLTSRQIAKKIGINFEMVRRYANRNGLTIPADDVVGKTRRIDANRIVEETVIGLDGTVMALQLVEMDELNPAQCAEWATSLSESLRVLTRFRNQLKEMARDEG